MCELKSKLEQVAEAVNKGLGNEYSVQSLEALKNNGIKVRNVLIRRGKEKMGITVYIPEKCLKRDLVSEIVDSVLQNYRKAEAQENPLDSVGSVVDKQFVLSNVVYQLINREKNEEFLKSVPHKEFLDLALIYRVVLKVDTEKVFSYVVKNVFLSEVGISVEEIEKVASKNGVDRLGVHCQELERDTLYLLTNSVGIGGASVMTDASVLSEIADKVGKNLIILPSSIHEVLLVVESDDLNIPHLQELVTEVNRSTKVPDEEFLSNSVYRFVRDTGVVEIVK